MTGNCSGCVWGKQCHRLSPETSDKYISNPLSTDLKRTAFKYGYVVCFHYAICDKNILHWLINYY